MCTDHEESDGNSKKSLRYLSCRGIEAIGLAENSYIESGHATVASSRTNAAGEPVGVALEIGNVADGRGGEDL